MDTFLAAATFVVTVLGTVCALYLQHISNKHFAEQNRIMKAQGPNVEEGSLSRPVVPKPPKWPLLAMAGIVFSVWAVVGYDYVDRHKATAWNDHLERVVGQHYIRETVPLDGREYIDTTFEDVSFTYNGTGPSRMTNVNFVYNDVPSHLVARLTTKNRVVAMTEIILATLNKTGGCKTDVVPESQ